MADSSTTPPDDQQQDPLAAIHDVIRDRTYQATNAAINDKINAEEDKVRNAQGDGTFFGNLWAMIKSWIFKLAESLGFEKQLAKMFGMPIPEKSETRTVSHEVADAVSDTMTSKEAAGMTADQLQAAVTRNVAAKLKDPENRKLAPSFTDAQLDEIARKAGEGARENYDQVHSYLNIDKDVADSLKQNIPLGSDKANQLATLIGKDTLESKDLDVIAAVVSPEIKKIALQKDKLAKEGDGAYADVAAQIKAQLMQSKDTLNQEGRQFTEAGITALADQLAVPVTNQLLGKDANAQPPAAFAGQMSKDQADAIHELMHKNIASATSEGVRISTVAGAMKGYDDSGYFSTNNSVAYPDSDSFAVLQKYYDKRYKDADGNDIKDANGKPTYIYVRNEVKDGSGELRDAEDKWEKFAVSWKRSYMATQRDKIGEITSDAVSQTLDNPDNQKLNRQQLASVLRTNIYNALQARKGEINAAGDADHSVDTIDGKNGKDSLAMIADGIAATVRTDDQKYAQLAAAQQALSNARMAVASASASAPVPPRTQDPNAVAYVPSNGLQHGNLSPTGLSGTPAPTQTSLNT